MIPQGRRQPSPIKDMNYFDAMNTIRSEKNQEYDEYRNGPDEACKSLTRAIVQRTRERQAKTIQRKFYYQTPRKRGQSNMRQNLKSQQHDEFAVLNYY